LGYLQTIPAHKLDISIDAYYKKMTNQLGYSQHAETLLNPFLEGELRQGNGEAWGIEFLIKRTIGKFTGQLSYAYTRSYLKIIGLNFDKRYPSHYDRPVDLCLNANYSTSPRVSLNLNVIYSSGMPYTTPTGFYYYRGEQVPLYSSLNNDRLPAYKRVDIGLNWKLNKQVKSFEHFLNISFYNFFGFKNVAFLNFNKTIAENGKFYIPADNTNSLEELVTYRYIYSLVPSITYSLTF
jgi:outer membrane receptor protein involved in Fe transport